MADKAIVYYLLRKRKNMERKEREDLEAVLSEHAGQRVVILTEETPGVCELCGVTDELRPYGPNRENICFDCGQKNPEMTERRMAERMLGE